MADLDKLVEELSKLTVLEAAELAKKLEALPEEVLEDAEAYLVGTIKEALRQGYRLGITP